MQEREEILVGGLVALMLVIWLGYELHESPRFAGSFWGGMLALGGGALMLVPAIYVPIKRVKWLRKRATKWVSMRTILALHIYAGVIGPILVLLHTGHKFESVLGIVLTALTLIVVVSGFVGRYLLSRLGRSVREADGVIKELRAQRELAGQELLRTDGSAELKQATTVGGMLRRVLFRSPDLGVATASPVARVVELSEALAETEYSRQLGARVKSTFQAWLKLHIVLSCSLYLLMGLHVWASLHFGLRWFE